MRLTIPEPKIDLYNDGFEGHDKLGRKATGDKLSDLVERIDDPLVIALDGAWGSGKSVFLKCWVGEHLKREGNTTQTVYFDAFKSDFLDDPLIALTQAISERLEKEPESNSAKAWRIAKNAAPFLGKAALRIGTAALVGKAISLTDDEDGASNDIGDAMAAEGGDIAKSTTDFWEKEDGKRGAMEMFRNALVQLTEPNEHSRPTRKLVVAVDELDRCRPDYALSLLEIIKHFFDVEGVHFLLGANMLALAGSAKARYGSSYPAQKYLQKFVTIEIHFEEANKRHVFVPSSIEHFRQVGEHLGIADHLLHDIVDKLLTKMPASHRPTLREAQRIGREIAVSRISSFGGELGYVAQAMLLILRTSNYEMLRGAIDGRAGADAMLEFFGLGERDATRFSQDFAIGYAYWICRLSQEPETEIPSEVKGVFSNTLNEANVELRRTFLNRIFEADLNSFVLN